MSGPQVVRANRRPRSVFFRAASASAWSNMPVVLTDFMGSPHRLKLDQSLFLEARISVYVATVGIAGAEIRVQYSTNDTDWVYFDGVDGPKVDVSTLGVRVSSWVTLAAAARADVFVRPVGINGDGATDPSFGVCTLELR